MVHWHDPVTLGRQFLLVVKLAHLFDGIYICEFMFRFQFALSVWTRRRQFKWPFAIYELCRWSTLTVAFCELVGLNLTSRFSCGAWSTLVLALSCFSLALATMLLVLRVVALWNNKLWVNTIAGTVWLGNLGCMIYGVTVNRTVWDPTLDTCLRIHTSKGAPAIISPFATNLVLLSLSLGPVLKMGYDGPLWRLVWSQGLVCVTVATVAGLPGTVLVLVNLNDAMNQMFQTPSLIIMTMCITRMYRQLILYSAQPTPSINIAASSPLRFAGQQSRNTQPISFESEPTVRQSKSASNGKTTDLSMESITEHSFDPLPVSHKLSLEDSRTEATDPRWG